MFRSLKGCRTGSDFSPLLSTRWRTQGRACARAHRRGASACSGGACVVAGTLHRERGGRGVAPASGPRFCNSVLFQGHLSSF